MGPWWFKGGSGLPISALEVCVRHVTVLLYEEKLDHDDSCYGAANIAT